MEHHGDERSFPNGNNDLLGLNRDAQSPRKLVRRERYAWDATDARGGTNSMHVEPADQMISV